MKIRLQILIFGFVASTFAVSAQAIPIAFNQVDVVTSSPAGLPIGSAIVSEFVLDVDPTGRATQVLSYFTTIPTPGGPITVPTIPVMFDLTFDGALSGSFSGIFGPNQIKWTILDGLGTWAAATPAGPLASGTTTITAVPEPGTVQLLLTSLCLMMVVGVILRR